MFSTVLSASLQGMQAEFIHVEADVGNGLPFFHMVGKKQRHTDSAKKGSDQSFSGKCKKKRSSI